MLEDLLRLELVLKTSADLRFESHEDSLGSVEQKSLGFMLSTYWRRPL